jgi:DNA polymerase-3 subunit delta
MGRALQRYKKLFDQVKRGSPHRVYFLYGPEEFLKREFIAELIKTSLGEENRAFNLDIFHGDDFDRDAFSDRVSSFPLFTDRRMVVLKKFESMSVSNQDFVIERTAAMADSVILVLEASTPKLDTARLKKLQHLADGAGLSFCFQHLSDDEAVERVESRLLREGFKIQPDALELLVGSAGTQLIDLANEVEKIVLSSEPGATITRDTVAAIVGRYRAENLFKFLDRMGKDEISETLATLHRIIDGGEEPVFVLAMLMRRIVQLLQVRLLMDEVGGSSKALAHKLEGSASPYQIAILVEQGKRFATKDLEIHLKNLRWADRMIKSSSVEPGHLLETALVAASHGKTLAPGMGAV